MTNINIIKDDLNETISIYDCTDYPSIGISINDVNGIRLSFSTYYSIINASNVRSLKANYEYKIISGTLTVNSVSYNQGMIFVAYEDFDFSNQDCKVMETGWFCMPNLNLPKTTLINVYTPSQLGEDNPTFQDAFRKCRYDIYTTITASGNLGNTKTYMVQGTQNSSIILGSGEIYYVGQTFTPTIDFTYTSSGTAYAVEFKDTSTTAFWTDYNAQLVKAEYNKMLNNPTISVSEDFRANYISCVSALSLPYIMSNLSLDYSEADIQNALDYVNGILDNNKLINNA